MWVRFFLHLDTPINGSCRLCQKTWSLQQYPSKNSTNLEPKYQNESLNVNWPNIGKQIENILPHATAHRYRLWTLQWYPRSSYNLFKHMWFGAFSAWKKPIPFGVDTHWTWGGKGQISWSHQKAILQQQKLELLILYNCSSTMKSVPFCLSEWAAVIHHLVRRCYMNVFRVPFLPTILFFCNCLSKISSNMSYHPNFFCRPAELMIHKLVLYYH